MTTTVKRKLRKTSESNAGPKDPAEYGYVASQSLVGDGWKASPGMPQLQVAQPAETTSAISLSPSFVSWPSQLRVSVPIALSVQRRGYDT
ncbi:hypothetical protein J6590_001216 [Homalodisca vitripennis]|nr:hypothetical protein J6590_001216 [Homalodisca vitripennis]